MIKLLIDINCERELCGDCDYKDYQYQCGLFNNASLGYNGTFQAIRCDKCLRAELSVNEKLYSVKDFIVHKLTEDDA